MAQRFPPEVHEYIREHCSGTPIRELAAMVNEHFGREYFSPSTMKRYMNNHKLRNGCIKGVEKGQPTATFPAEVRAFIAEHQQGLTRKELTQRLNEELGTSFTEEQLKAYCFRYNLRNDNTGRFQKGCVSRNKGKHMETKGRMAETQFKKGQMPYNEKPIGYETVDCEGYVRVKVKGGAQSKANENFKHKHVAVWEAANGPVPPGSMIIFLDGNKLNCELSNLAIITNREHAYLNKKGFRFSDPEKTKVAIMTARLRLAAKDAEERAEKK